MPCFARRPKSRGAAVPQPSGQSRVSRISCLGPVFKAKAAVISPPRTKASRTSGPVRPERAERWKAARPGGILKTSREAGPEGSAEPEPAPPHREAGTSSRKTVVFQLKDKPNKSRVSVDDVENMARSNQWSALTSRSLLLWLRNRGIPVSSKLRKEELMMKVMSRLAEA